MSFSDALRRQLQSTDDALGILFMVRIESPYLTGGPIRLVADTRDWMIGGVNYVGLPMRIGLPSDEAGAASAATVVIDNIGRDLTTELETLAFGVGLDVTLMMSTRGNPSLIEWEYPAAIRRVSISTTQVVVSLGDDSLLRQGACLLRYDPLTSPGLF